MSHDETEDNERPDLAHRVPFGTALGIVSLYIFGKRDVKRAFAAF